MSTMRFIEQHENYSLYERPNGDEVCVAHGFPRVYLVDFDTAWMMDQWQRIRRTRSQRFAEHAFLDWMRKHLIDPDVMDDIKFCTDCGEPGDDQDASTIEGGGFACDDCIERYYTSCYDCSEYCKETVCTLDDDEVCDRCREYYYSFCDRCDGYYRDSREHDHDDDDDECGCESSAFVFAIRNDGHGMLWNDQKVTVSLPAGTLDSEGVARIQRYLMNEGMYDASALVEGMDKRWQTRDGNFTKRLSRALYQKHAIKISPTILSQVGSIARDHSNAVDFLVATTRDLNQSAADFGHEGSCWWQSYFAGRCTLKTNGGFGLRSFSSYGDVMGRAWVMPLVSKNERLEPTYNTESPDAFVVFNCYGELEGYAATRIISHMAGMTYRKVSFACSPMFVNGDSAYLIAPEEIASKYTDGSLNLSVYQHSNLFATEQAAAAAKELVNV